MVAETKLIPLKSESVACVPVEEVKIYGSVAGHVVGLLQLAKLTLSLVHC
jgi:hypothetical protein